MPGNLASLDLSRPHPQTRAFQYSAAVVRYLQHTRLYRAQRALRPRGLQGFGAVAVIRSPVKGTVGLFRAGRDANGPPFNWQKGLGRAVGKLAITVLNCLLRLGLLEKYCPKSTGCSLYKTFSIQNHILPSLFVLFEHCADNSPVCVMTDEETRRRSGMNSRGTRV